MVSCEKSFFVILSVLCSLSVTAAHAAAATSADANYFTDADALGDLMPAYGDQIDEQRIPAERRAFCARTDRQIIDPLLNHAYSQGALTFLNPQGPFHTGVCWAHSRFQRSISYLADFHPEKPRPSDAQADKIVSQLVSMNKVVTIPGFENVDRFSMVYEAKITAALGAWYRRCLFSGDCAHRAFDASSENPQAMRARMDHLYERMFDRAQMLFLRLYGKSFGITDSHAWLLVDMIPTRAAPRFRNRFASLTRTGYELKIVDSNYPMTVITIPYAYGDKTLRYKGDEILPHEDYDGDLVDINHALKAYCVPPKKNRR